MTKYSGFVLNVWIPSISWWTKIFLLLVWSPASVSFSDSKWDLKQPAVDTQIKAVPDLHTHQPREPPEAQGITFLIPYYICFFRSLLRCVHHSSHGVLLWKQNSLCWNSGEFGPLLKGLGFSDGEQQITGLFLPLELLMYAGDHTYGSVEIT